MSFLINPFIYAGAPAYPNQYSMFFTHTTTVANIDRIYINNKSNAIDTAFRDTTPNITMSMWFRRSAGLGANTGVIFSKLDNFAGLDRCFNILQYSGGLLQVYGQYDSNNVSVNLIPTQLFSSTTEWYHLVFVYDNTQTLASNIAKLYINGSEVTSFATQTVSTTNKRFVNQTTENSRAFVTFGCAYAGAAANTKSAGFGGNIDEFTFWDKSLSPSEVAELYNGGEAANVSGMTSYSTNCLAWYRFGDTPGDSFSTNWAIKNVKGTASTDMISENMVLADRVTDVF